MKPNTRQKQQLRKGKVHNWYRFVLAFPDHLVKELCDRFSVACSKDVVLDPFCGTGTTLVECKKLGINAVGIEANPSSVFASRVKTTWDLDADQVLHWADQVVKRAAPICEKLSLVTQPLFHDSKIDNEVDQLKSRLRKNSSVAQYFIESGMLKRGWISEIPFYKAVAILESISELDIQDKYRDVLLLALIGALLERIANITFGPELYVTKRKIDADAIGAFNQKATQIVEDLRYVQHLPQVGEVTVFQGDSRECDTLLQENGVAQLDFVMTSPPYPTEKDYTRNTRLELVFLGYVTDGNSLRAIKRQMIRSHSKGIYSTDRDYRYVAHFPAVQALVEELRTKSAEKTYGFAKLYHRIIEEYFGGMYRHLASLARLMRSGGQCAYVLGEQRTYLQTYVPTARILAEIAEASDIGFKVEDIVTWRIRKGTTGSRESINEEILILRRT